MKGPRSTCCWSNVPPAPAHGRRRVGALAGVVPALAVSLIVMSGGSAHSATYGGDSPGGTVSVGASGGASSPGGTGTLPGSGAGGGSGTSPGRGGGGNGGGATGGSGSGSSGTLQPICTDTPLTLNDAGGFAPGGPTPGSWYSVTCIYPGPTGAMTTRTVWIPNAAPAVASGAATAPTAGVDPRILALQAERTIRLPSPVPRTNPTGEAVVNLPTWLWIDPAAWSAVSVSASAGPVTATAVASPVSVVWSMGDGASVSCTGPGTAFDTALPAAGQSTDCSYAYPVSSAGQPAPDGNPADAAFTVTATVNWSVTWTSLGTAGGGVLPGLTTDAVLSLPVEQVQSVDVGLTGLLLGSPPGPHRDGLRRDLGTPTRKEPR